MRDWLPLLLVGGGSSIATILLMMFLMDGGTNGTANGTVEQVAKPGEEAVLNNTPRQDFPLYPPDAVFAPGVTGPVSMPTSMQDWQKMSPEEKEMLCDTVQSQNDLQQRFLEVEETKSNNDAANQRNWFQAIEFGVGGAAAGAAIGSVVPGIGTAIGAVVGGGLGLLGAGVASANDGDPWPFW